MKVHRFMTATLLVGLATSLSASDDRSERKATPKAKAAGVAEIKAKPLELIDYLDFVFVASDRPVLVRLHLLNNGKPYGAAWEDYLQKLHAYLDKNSDGVLDKTEAERAPSLQFLQFHLQGAIGLPYQGSKGQMEQFDTNKDGRISPTEFKEFYRRLGFAPLQFFSTSNRANTDTVTNTIYKRLDSNKDGKLSAKEMVRAETVLSHYDLDENEMLTAAELMPGGEDNNPFGRPLEFGQASANTDMGFLEIKPENVAGVSRQVLAHYDKDRNGKLSQKEVAFDKTLFDKLDANHDGQLDAKEFTAFFRGESDLELIARVGNMQQKDGMVANLLRKTGMPALQAVRAEVFNPSNRSMPLATKVQRSDPSAVAFTLGDAHIGLSASEQQFRQFPRQFFEQQFREADAGKKNVVDRKQAMSAQFLSQIFDIVDRNGDDKVTEQELKAYLDMQSEGAGCRLQLTITDEGRSLFELLDGNGDGRLSLRELRTGWARMKPMSRSDNGLSRDDISRRLDVSVGQTQRRVRVVQVQSRQPILAAGQRAAPLWFQKMDRNQDGDISPREFIGSDEDFRKLDADGDGLISIIEARQLEERVKK